MSYGYDDQNHIWVVLINDVVVRICDSEIECLQFIYSRGEAVHK